MIFNKRLKITHTNIIRLFKLSFLLLSFSLVIMIFFVSTKDDFEKTFLVETKDLNLGSEGNSFQIDSAQLSSLNINGNSFKIKANKIYPFDNRIPIISSNEISGNINLSSDIIIEIKAEKLELNSENSTLKLDGGFEIRNKYFQISGNEILFNFNENIIMCNNGFTFLTQHGQISGGKIKIININKLKQNLIFYINDGVNFKYLL